MVRLFYDTDKAPLLESKPFKIKKASLAIRKKHFFMLRSSLADPTKLRFENSTIKKNAQASLAFFLIVLFIRDHDRIQTCNLLSRNQVRYSVAPHGQIRVQI